MYDFFLFLVIPLVIGLIMGSFLNVIASRLGLYQTIKTSRSFCPQCKTTLAWYDLIPVFSWLFLRGKCRYCKHQISFLYPFIEILTSVTTVALVNTLHSNVYPNFFANPSILFYMLFFYALIIGVRTDIESMVVLQIFTLWLVPFGLLAAYLGFLKISFYESLIGALVGYIVLFAVAKAFKYFAKKDGLGDGDMEVLSLIGAFLGPLGLWIALMVASISGSIYGMAFLTITKKGKNTRIPFVPFLAFGAAIFFFFSCWITKFILFYEVIPASL